MFAECFALLGCRLSSKQTRKRLKLQKVKLPVNTDASLQNRYVEVFVGDEGFCSIEFDDASRGRPEKVQRSLGHQRRHRRADVGPYETLHHLNKKISCSTINPKTRIRQKMDPKKSIKYRDKTLILSDHPTEMPPATHSNTPADRNLTFSAPSLVGRRVLWMTPGRLFARWQPIWTLSIESKEILLDQSWEWDQGMPATSTGDGDYEQRQRAPRNHCCKVCRKLRGRRILSAPPWD